MKITTVGGLALWLAMSSLSVFAAEVSIDEMNQLLIDATTGKKNGIWLPIDSRAYENGGLADVNYVDVNNILKYEDITSVMILTNSTISKGDIFSSIMEWEIKCERRSFRILNYYFSKSLYGKNPIHHQSSKIDEHTRPLPNSSAMRILDKLCYKER